MTALPPDFFDGPLWKERRVYSRAEAWLDCWRAGDTPARKHLIGGRLVQVPANSFAASTRYLAQRWTWSRSRVDRFLAILRDTGMIDLIMATPVCQMILLRTDGATHGPRTGHGGSSE